MKQESLFLKEQYYFRSNYSKATEPNFIKFIHGKKG